MKKTDTAILAFTGIFLLIVSATIFLFADKVYEGKEVFQTEQEYTAFKEAVAEDAVSIKNIDVLSSDPPIIVDFCLFVNNNYKFEYGEGTFSPILMITTPGGVVMLLWAIVGHYTNKRIINNQKEGEQ